MHTIRQALQEEVLRLASAQIETPHLDAELLLSHVLGVSRVYGHAHPEQTLSEDVLAEFQALIQRRFAGEPVAYIVGVKEFWSLNVMVSQHVLVPRPETELLVEKVLHAVPAEAPAHVLELGTGSGAIALAMASERPNWQVTATDISAAALSVAQCNAEKLSLHNIQFVRSDWFDNVTHDTFDVIVSNPPYIAEQDSCVKSGALSYEPRGALVSGKDGLDAIRQIIAHAKPYLKSGGQLLLEHSDQQGAAVRGLLSRAGFDEICIHQDLKNRDRVTRAIA